MSSFFGNAPARNVFDQEQNFNIAFNRYVNSQESESLKSSATLCISCCPSVDSLLQYHKQINGSGKLLKENKQDLMVVIHTRILELIKLQLDTSICEEQDGIVQKLKKVLGSHQVKEKHTQEVILKKDDIVHISNHPLLLDHMLSTRTGIIEKITSDNSEEHTHALEALDCFLSGKERIILKGARISDSNGYELVYDLVCGKYSYAIKKKYFD